MTEFRYCSKIAGGINDYEQLSNLIDYEGGMARSDRAFIFTDNHDNQRGHGGAGIKKTIPNNYARFKTASCFNLLKQLQEMLLRTKVLATTNKPLLILLPKIMASRVL